MIIRIDDETLNTLQAKSNLKNITIPKSVYADLIGKLSTARVRGIAWDIVFQNADSEEEKFVEALTEGPPSVIATTFSECFPQTAPVWVREFVAERLEKNESFLFCNASYT